MKMGGDCLSCIVGQAVKIARLTGTKDPGALYRTVFRYLSTADFDLTSPELSGEVFRLMTETVGNADPYRELKRYYDLWMLRRYGEYATAATDLEAAVRIAIAGNIIDFSPAHDLTDDDVLRSFARVNERPLAIDHLPQMKRDLEHASLLLYLCDNAGEIVLDKLLAAKIKEAYPHLSVVFAVRGAAVVNDSTREDAALVGLSQIGEVIDNGDYAQGTVLQRTGEDFRRIYDRADLVIAKGQANFECLSDEDKNIYFLLMAKCAFISGWLGVEPMSAVCANGKWLRHLE